MILTSDLLTMLFLCRLSSFAEGGGASIGNDRWTEGPSKVQPAQEARSTGARSMIFGMMGPFDLKSDQRVKPDVYNLVSNCCRSRTFRV